MKSILRIATASFAFAAIGTVSMPALAGPAHVVLSVGDGYYQPQASIQAEVIYAAPMPVSQYRNEGNWRQQEWRENEWRQRERREHYWRERNEWHGHQWQEQFRPNRGEPEERWDNDRHGDRH